MKFPKTSKKARKWQNFFDKEKDKVGDDVRGIFERVRDAFADVAETAELELESRSSPWLVFTLGWCSGLMLGIAVTVWVL